MSAVARTAAPRGAGRTNERRGGPPSWHKDPEGRRERMLAAAAKLFGAEGYAAVGGGAIAREAGVAEGTLYHHFGSKEGVLLAVAERYGRGFAAAMFEGLATESELPSVETVVRRAFAYVAESDPLFGLFLLTDGSGASSPSILERPARRRAEGTGEPVRSELARQANRRAILEALERLVAGWSARGLVRAASPRITAELLFAVVESALRECFVIGRREQAELYMQEVVHAIRGILGLASNAGGPA